MNIIGAGIDYSTADIDIREKFSFTVAQKEVLYGKLKEIPQILGAVILSTCNRMELFFSCTDDMEQNPCEVICNIMGLSVGEYAPRFNQYKGDELIDHLCLLACGAKSQIFGEDQIITQVKEAVAFGRAQEATDSVLEVLFRAGITCGKKVRTNVKLTQKEVSVSHKVLEKIQENHLPIHNVMVIGNGEMGRHIAGVLVKNGFAVSMTIRQYKHRKVEVPEGVTPIDYDDKYNQMPCFDAVVSATLSPHFTIKKQGIALLENHPKYFFDLAVPRDIEKIVGELAGVQVFDIDDLASGEVYHDHTEQLAEIGQYIQKYKSDFYKWDAFRQEVSIYS